MEAHAGSEATLAGAAVADRLAAAHANKEFRGRSSKPLLYLLQRPIIGKRHFSLQKVSSVTPKG